MLKPCKVRHDLKLCFLVFLPGEIFSACVLICKAQVHKEKTPINPSILEV